MPTALPARNIFDGTAAPVTSVMKTALGSLRDFLAETIGPAGGGPIVPSLNGGQIAGLRNVLINGDFSRNKRVGPFATNGYTLDRWKMTAVAATSVSQAAGLYGYGKYSMSLTASSGTNSTSITQALRQNRARSAQGKTITFSVYAVVTTGTCGLVLAIQKNATPDDSTVTFATIISAGSTITTAFQRFSVTANIPADGTAEGLCALLQTSNMANGATVNFYGAQMEPGTVPSIFEALPEELTKTMCAWSYENSYTDGVAVATPTTAGAAMMCAPIGSSYYQAAIPYGEKNKAPTLRFWDCAGNLTRASIFDSASAAQTNNLSVISTSSVTQRGGWIRCVTGATVGTFAFHWEADSEI